MKHILIFGILLASINVKAQTCECEKEFSHIKNIVEQNFAGFPDRIKTLSKATYIKKTTQLRKLTRGKFASDNCPLIILRYLEMFKSYHLGFFHNFDPLKVDTNFVNYRPVFKINDTDLARLKKSKSWEGVYYSTHDSSIKIAVLKDPTPLHDYVGVMLETNGPTTWKKGMVKFEGKLVNDNLLRGLLYMRNHRPKLQRFFLYDDNNMVGGDWRRDGTAKKESAVSSSVSESSLPIDAKRLSPNTFYIKIASFNPDHKPTIDSILKANEPLLNVIPNLVLDLRDNGGGADDLWQPLIPYLYTQPIRMTGADALATDTVSTPFLRQY